MLKMRERRRQIVNQEVQRISKEEVRADTEWMKTVGPDEVAVKEWIMFIRTDSKVLLLWNQSLVLDWRSL